MNAVNNQLHAKKNYVNLVIIKAEKMCCLHVDEIPKVLIHDIFFFFRNKYNISTVNHSNITVIHKIYLLHYMIPKFR